MSDYTWDYEIRKARKEKICTWCREKIAKGERYNYQEYVYEGKFGNNKLHFECNIAWIRVINYFVRSHGWDRYEDEIWGYVWPGGSVVYKHPRGGFYWVENMFAAYEMQDGEVVEIKPKEGK